MNWFRKCCYLYTCFIFLFLPSLSFAGEIADEQDPYYFLVVNPYQHQDYGFSYPVTFNFYLRDTETGISVYKKYHQSDVWSPIESKSDTDFFNGVEAFRYEENRNRVFVSLAFGDDSDTLFLKFVNKNNEVLSVNYQGVTKYYDNRKAAITCTADDWAVWFDEKFRRTCRIFRDHNLWLSPAVITAGCDSATWVHIQEQIDSGLVDVVSHSRTHPNVPYADHNSEVTGSKWDLTTQLSLPTTSRKGEQSYVYVWVAPYGSYSDEIDALVSWNKYLVSRMYFTGEFNFPSWDASTNKFNHTGVSREMGPLWAGTTDIVDLNSAFDQAYSSGGVYHLMCHPNVIEWDKDYPWLHMDYIKDRKDIWYAGMGHLFVYHYLQSFSKEFLTFYSSEEKILQQKIPVKVYPNPFHSETHIRYTLPEQSEVQLFLMDAMGRRVRVLVDELQRKGPHEVLLNGQDLAPGMYIYYLKTDLDTQSGRILKID